jgi:hypothetical protein
MASRAKIDEVQAAADSVLPGPAFIGKVRAIRYTDQFGEPSFHATVFVKKGTRITPAKRKLLWAFGEQVRSAVSDIDPTKIVYLAFDELAR